jgi:hypothetical protein
MVRGGPGRNQGRKKEAPEGAKRRTLLLTDKELELVRQYIHLYRNELLVEQRKTLAKLLEEWIAKR